MGIAAELEEVSVQLGPVRILDSVSLTLEEGAHVGLVGPNGAGKTSLANVLCGYYHPSGGRVRVFGIDTTRAEPVRIASLGVRRSLQSVGRVRGITALEFLELGMETLWPTSMLHTVFGTRAGRRAERSATRLAASTLREVGLDRFGPVPFEDCPYGVRKFVDVLRTLVGGGRVAVLDEPTSGLSDGERAQMLDLLARWMGESAMTLLLIDHDVSFVRSLCPDMIAIEAGRVLSTGTTSSVLADPAVIHCFMG